MPCYNEAGFIEKAVDSLMDEYVRKNAEILIADGMSTDGTRDIVRSLIGRGYPIRLLDNKDRYQVYGLNLAVKEARGEIIVRTDAHALYPKGYVQKCVDLLESTGAVNVGGVMVPEGHSAVQKAAASAMQHPLGVGDARFHLGDFSGYVDTVYLGAFKKEIFKRVGLYDTTLQTNEDAELNFRILKAGEKIYLDGSLKVKYFPRDSFLKLIRQYFRYGAGRCRTVLKHRELTSTRQLAPVFLVVIILLSLGIGFWRPLVLLVPLFYFVSVVLAVFLSGRKKKNPFLQKMLTAIAIILIHLSWGMGFLFHLIFRFTKKKRRVPYAR